MVRRSVEAAARGDLEAAAAELDPAIEVDDTDMFDAGSYRGHDAYFKWIAQWGESFETWRVEGLEFRPAPEGRVVALFTMIATGKGSGVEIRRSDALVCEVRGGKVVKIGYYNDQGQALDAAGLVDRA